MGIVCASSWRRRAVTITVSSAFGFCVAPSYAARAGPTKPNDRPTRARTAGVLCFRLARMGSTQGYGRGAPLYTDGYSGKASSARDENHARSGRAVFLRPLDDD